MRTALALATLCLAALTVVGETEAQRPIERTADGWAVLEGFEFNDRAIRPGSDPGWWRVEYRYYVRRRSLHWFEFNCSATRHEMDNWRQWDGTYQRWRVNVRMWGRGELGYGVSDRVLCHCGSIASRIACAPPLVG